MVHFSLTRLIFVAIVFLAIFFITGLPYILAKKKLAEDNPAAILFGIAVGLLFSALLMP